MLKIITNTEITDQEVHSKTDISYKLSTKVQITVEKEEKRTIYYMQRS